MKAEMLKFPQIKLNQIQRKSSSFSARSVTYSIQDKQQQSIFMKSMESNITALFFFNYGELHVTPGAVLGDLCTVMSTHFNF